MATEEQANGINYIDAEEQEIVESLERGEWNPVSNLDEARAQAAQYAEATLKKDNRMNIRLSSRDILQLKARAAEEGVPYQTLVTMILHKYVSGRMVEKK
ncbi:MAG: antitoxin [Spirochaetaceae bacterium]|nr:MAG: antitoxin [Spirochaetaceae bacterium]